MFKNKIAVITGGAQGIGRCIADEFRKQGASVCIIDRQPNEYFVGDISSEQVLRDFAGKVIAEYGRIDYLINNAIPLSKGLNACTYDEFNYALRVGVTAPFFLTKLFMPYFSKSAAIVNISEAFHALLQQKCGHRKYLILPRPDEPAGHRKLYRRKRRHRCTDPRHGRHTRRKSPRQFHLAGLDRHLVQRILRPGRFPAPGGPGGEPDGYRQYGALSLLG